VNPYPLLYRLGITPWNRDAVPTRLVEVVSERTSAGRAPDLGCGTGRDAVYLAEHGWTVTAGRRRQAGVDGAREIAACRRVRQLDPPDVTQLDALGLEDGFDFVLDRGCFDGLSNRERQRCAMRVTDRTGPGSRLLLFGFQPRRFGLGPRGVTAEDVQGRFGRSWDVVSVTPDTALHRLPPWLGNPRPTWYLLARTA